MRVSVMKMKKGRDSILSNQEVGTGSGGCM
ncbi:hypothetical protein NC652_003520 [Populus alba x Populus x berolinensis]|nr:hypothetical protein NC652_003520 [Populus alba x Populus x berolinensis]